MQRKLSMGVAVAAAAGLVLAGCAVTGPSGRNDDSGEIKLGWLLPQTGPIASLGAPQVAALELALKDINDAGGANGRTVGFTGADEAGDPAIAGQAVDRLISGGVSAIIGAGSSSITMSVIDKITGSGIVQCSGMNTTPALSTYPDDGYYFRTVPSDVLQGAALSDAMTKDGVSSVSIMARSDSYASGLASATEESLEKAGIPVVVRVDYDPQAQNLSGEVNKVVAAGADAIVLFSFDEGAKILQGLLEKGINPATTRLYGTDALPISSLAESVDPSDLSRVAGMKFTQASSGEGSDFTTRLLEVKPGLSTTAFTPYFYDCAILIALAIESAQSSDPTVFKDQIVPLTKGETECTSYSECKTLLTDGKSIAYIGAAGPLKFDDSGEPTTGLYDVLELQPDGMTTTFETVRHTR